MKRLLVVLLLLLGSVLLGYPASAATGAEGDAPVVAEVTSVPEESPDPALAGASEPAADLAPEPEAASESVPPADESASAEGAPVAPPESAAAAEGEVSSTPAAAEVVQAAAVPGDDDRVAAAAAPAKVYVCKYVGQPGVDERLKAGKQPISVSSASTGGAAVGNYFADGQDRSFVVAIDDGGPAPTADACPAAAVRTVVAPEPPIVSDPTCDEVGTLTLPVTTGVTYLVDPVYTGAPGTYTVTPTALPNYVLDPTVVVPFVVTVLPQLSGQVDCPIPPDPVKKVWVCKYVGQPGVDEVLKAGKNPIEVSVNALPGSPVDPQVGDEFNDAQERSVVVALSPANPEPTVDDCQAPIVPDPEVTAEPPTATPATCDVAGVLVLPTTAGVLYSSNPLGSGPGDYVVTAVAEADFDLVGEDTFPITVPAQLTGPACDDVGSGGGTPPVVTVGTGGGLPTPVASPAVSGLLPSTGAGPLWMLLVAGPLTAGGMLLLVRRRPMMHWTDSGAISYSLVGPGPRPMVTETAVGKHRGTSLDRLRDAAAFAGKLLRGGIR